MPSDRGTSFACDRCGLEGFRTYDDAASHESQCSLVQPRPPPGAVPMGSGGGGAMMGMMGYQPPPADAAGMPGGMMGGAHGGGAGPLAGMGSPMMPSSSPSATTSPGSTDQRKRRRPGSPGGGGGGGGGATMGGIMGQLSSPPPAPGLYSPAPVGGFQLPPMQAAQQPPMPPSLMQPLSQGGSGGVMAVASFQDTMAAVSAAAASQHPMITLPRLVLSPEEDLRGESDASSNLCLGLSDVDSLACRHIEAFVLAPPSTSEEAETELAHYRRLATTESGRRLPEAGDVGVRCVHCRARTGGGSDRYAALFPDGPGSLPDELRVVTERHLTTCPSAPRAVRSSIENALHAERKSDEASERQGVRDGGEWRKSALLEYCADFCRRGGIGDKGPGGGAGLTFQPQIPAGMGGGGDAGGGVLTGQQQQASGSAGGGGAGQAPQQQHQAETPDQDSPANPDPSPPQVGPSGGGAGVPGPGQQQRPPGAPGGPMPDFPFFHDGYGAWICKYCCSTPYPYRAQGSVLQGPPHILPEPGFVEGHMQVCRGGIGGYPPPPGGSEMPPGMPGGPSGGYPGGLSVGEGQPQQQGGPPPPYGQPGQQPLPPRSSPPPSQQDSQRRGLPQPPHGPPTGQPPPGMPHGPPQPHPYYPMPPHPPQHMHGPPPPYMGGPYPPHMPPHMMGFDSGAQPQPGGPQPGAPPGAPQVMPHGRPPGAPPPPGLTPPGQGVPSGQGVGPEPPSGTDAALRSAIEYLEGAERMRLRLEAAAASAQQQQGGAVTASGMLGALALPGGGAPPSSESVELVVPDDKVLLTDYFYHLMRQLKLCRFSESDRKTRGGKRENVPVGYGGLQCVHCAGAPNSRKFFWSNVDRLANSFAEIPGHVLKCRRCPARTKQALAELKLRHPEQMAKLPRGSQKVFFRRMWRRVHDDHPQQETKEGEGKGKGKAKGKTKGGGGKSATEKEGAKPVPASSSKSSSSIEVKSDPAVAMASPAGAPSLSALTAERTPSGPPERVGDEVEAKIEDEVGGEMSAAAGTMQGVFATPIAPRGARGSQGGPGGDIAAEEEEEEEEVLESPRKRSRTSPAASLSSASPRALSSPAALVVSGSTEEAARALAASASAGPSSLRRRRPCVLLAIEEDKEWLSDTDCFVRGNVEVFVATARDVEEARLDRKYPIAAGQVGIRCIHCASTVDEEEEGDGTGESRQKASGARGNAVSYPYSISGIYESVREFQRLHLESCKNLTPEVRSRLLGQRGSASLSSVLRKYYVMAARALGMYDTSDGIRAGGTFVGVGRGAAFEFASGGAPGSGGGSAKASKGGRAGIGDAATPSPAPISRQLSATDTPMSQRGGLEGLGMLGIATPAGLGGTPASAVMRGHRMDMGSPLMGSPGPTPPHAMLGASPHHLGPPQASAPFGMGLESAMTPLEGRKRKASVVREIPPSSGGGTEEEEEKDTRKKRS